MAQLRIVAPNLYINLEKLLPHEENYFAFLSSVSQFLMHLTPLLRNPQLTNHLTSFLLMDTNKAAQFKEHRQDAIPKGERVAVTENFTFQKQEHPPKEAQIIVGEKDATSFASWSFCDNLYGGQSRFDCHPYLD